MSYTTIFGNFTWYHGHIKSCVVAFGTIFNNLRFVRKGNDGREQVIKVPLMFSSKDKYLAKLTQDPTLSNSVQMNLPRMVFDITSVNYDPARLINPMSKTISDKYKSFAPVPYTLNIQLSVATTTMEDGMQIVEQILPWFNPSFVVTANQMPLLNIKRDIPILLRSVSLNQEGTFGELADTRLIVWDLDFEVQAYIYPPDKPASVIKFAQVDMFTDIESALDLNNQAP